MTVATLSAMQAEILSNIPSSNPAVLTAAALRGVLADLTTLLGTLAGNFLVRKTVDFNVSGDNAIPIDFPPGMTRYIVGNIRISGLVGASLTTATIGLFTQTGGGGVAVVSNSAITVSTPSENANNNTQSLTPGTVNTQSYTAPTLYARIGTPQGAAATATVSVNLIFLS